MRIMSAWLASSALSMAEETSPFQIVGDEEADSKIGLISVSSPIARALIGKTEGDVASVQTPGGVRELEILEVRYV